MNLLVLKLELPMREMDHSAIEAVPLAVSKDEIEMECKKYQNILWQAFNVQTFRKNTEGTCV